MAAQTLGKVFSLFGFAPSVDEFFLNNHEQQLMNTKFVNHLAYQGISYDTDEEYQMRLGIFAEKDRKIDEINSSQNSFKLGHNHMSTWTEDEYSKVKGLVPNPEQFKAPVTKVSQPSGISVDWVAAGKVSPVKNQGQCGSCWAFSSIAAIESAYAISSGNLVQLSEQQLVNCCKVYGANGCNGGNYAPAFYYARYHKIALEELYPYEAKDGECNTAIESNGLVKLSNYGAVAPRSVSELKSQLDIQPVGIAVEAGNIIFQQYTSGIVDSTDCGQALDHAVTAVGYGTQDGVDYVMVRNSWGASWGDQGYIYIALNNNDICGVMMQPYYPTI